MRRPTKRGVWQVATVVLLAAATAGVVVINDMTQSPRAVAPAFAAGPTPQLVGEGGGASRSGSNGIATAPSWLVRTAVSALNSNRDTTPSSAYWGYAPAGNDVWDLLKAADSDTAYYWLVFDGDFQSFPASGGPVARGHSLVLAIDAVDHTVTASALTAQAAVDPAGVHWLQALDLTVGEN